MASAPEGREEPDQQQLLRVIRKVRNRWRLRTFLRGMAILAGATLGAFLVTAYGLELFRFSPEAVAGFRVGTYALLAVVAYLHVVRPLARRVDDQRVALYLEENEPSLEASVLTAVDAPGESRGPLLEHLVREALARSRKVEFGERVDRGRLYRYSGALAAVGVVGVLLFLLGPSTLRTGATALLFPGQGADDLTPFSIQVDPGDVTVARGSDQIIRARLVGFQSGQVELVTLDPDGGVRDALSMFPGEEEGYEHVLLDLEEPLRYFVRSSGVRSATFTLDVAEIPYVERLDLVYHFPDYTGLEPRTVEDGGNIAVLPGTRVVFRAASSVATPAGRLVLDDSTELALRPDSTGRLVGEHTVRERSGYRIELERPDGRMGAASPHYTIDLLRDQPPAVEFEKPGRDTRASPIDDVFLQVRGEDDYGLRSLELVYSVNGGAEDTVSLVRGGGDLPTEASAGHTLFLEEWDLVPGDVVSYYAVARDNNRASGPRETVSDIYFLDVRPFRKDFSAADQRGGGGGGGGAGAMDQGAYVDLQRQIVAATFNLIRDRESYDDEEWRSDLTNVSLSQKRLHGDVSTLVDRIRTRLSGSQGEEFATIARELPKALEAMEEAIEHLEGEDAREALGPEQQALLHLQRADEAYRDVQVSLQQGGGGGGQQSPQAEDLADLFELELDQLRNQYETVQRGQRQGTSQELDETMERLKELARRQQQEAERQARRLAAEGGAPSGSARQQALAEETEEAARQLERLAREERSRELEETARNLREAADAMRRAAAGNQGDGASAARGAAERLEQARRLLDESRAARFRNEVGETLERARRLRREQEEIAGEVAELDSAGDERRQATRRLVDRKEEMANEVAELASELDRTAARARREDREAARPLQEAASGIREDKLEEKIRFSRGLISGDEDERAASFEDQIAGDFESLVERLEQADETARESEDGSSLERALEEARSLARGMETLERRLEERTGASDAARAGRDQGPQERSETGSATPRGEQQARAEGQPGQGEPGAQQDGQQAPTGGAAARGGAPGSPSDGRPASGARSGSPRGGGPPLDEETVRQFRQEFGERAQDARTLRDQLREAGRETDDLDRAIEVMEALDDRRAYTDMEEILQLQRAAVESLERLEFSLRREVESREGPRMRLPGSGDVPREFQNLVEEYYRVLSEDHPPGGS